MLPFRNNSKTRRPRHHIHFISMRVYYWRHFACYSFMLTLLGIHVVFQYTVAPPSGSERSPNDWAPGEAGYGPFPDLALACEQWIGRRSLKVPKSFMDQEQPPDNTLFGKERSSTVAGNSHDSSKDKEIHANLDEFQSQTSIYQNTFGHLSPLTPVIITKENSNNDKNNDLGFKNDIHFDIGQASKESNLKRDKNNVFKVDNSKTFLHFHAADPQNLREIKDYERTFLLKGTGQLRSSPSPLVAMETIKEQTFKRTEGQESLVSDNRYLPQVGSDRRGGRYKPEEPGEVPPDNTFIVLPPGDGGEGNGQRSKVLEPTLRESVIVNKPVIMGEGGSDQGRQDDLSPSIHTATAAPQVGGREMNNLHHLRYTFTCSNIHLISIKRKLGQGVTKQVYLGLYQGHKVAIKMVTRNVIDVSSCMKKLRHDSSVDPTMLSVEKHRCYTLPNMKLMKEILLLNQLNHPNLLQLRGYCVRSEETDSTSLQEHGIVAVYEYGLRFYVSNLRDWPWSVKMTTAMQLADLLDYLQHSPLGSLRISDFKDAHFLLAEGRIKLTDLDDVTSLEPSCLPDNGPDLDLKGQKRTKAHICGFNLKCIAGICPGYNALKNLDNFNRLFFSNLLVSDDGRIEEQMIKLRNRLDSLSISASELKRILNNFLEVPLQAEHL